MMVKSVWLRRTCPRCNALPGKGCTSRDEYGRPYAIGSFEHAERRRWTWGMRLAAALRMTRRLCRRSTAPSLPAVAE